MPTSLFVSRTLSSLRTMGRSIDQILQTLLARPLPPLEPGTKVYDPSLTKDIKGSGEHRYVIAGESLPVVYAPRSARADHVFTSALVEGVALTITALHLANDDIENCHLIAQAHEGVSHACVDVLQPCRRQASH